MVFFISIQISSEDPVQMLHSAASDLGKHCLSMSHNKRMLGLYRLNKICYDFLIVR